MVEIFTEIKGDEQGLSIFAGEKQIFDSPKKALNAVDKRLIYGYARLGGDLLVLGLAGVKLLLASQNVADTDTPIEKVAEYLPQITLGIYVLIDMKNQVQETVTMSALKENLLDKALEK